MIKVREVSDIFKTLKILGDIKRNLREVSDIIPKGYYKGFPKSWRQPRASGSDPESDT